MKIFSMLLATLAVTRGDAPLPSSQYLPANQQPTNSYLPPTNQYLPPTNQYLPPTNQYLPPTNQYLPPTKTYLPPQTQQPSNQYSPPGNQYLPPQTRPANSYLPPSTSYGTPSQPSRPSTSYGVPRMPSPSYGTPSTPSSSYGVPSVPVSSYGAPTTSYGTPAVSNSYLPPGGAGGYGYGGQGGYDDQSEPANYEFEYKVNDPPSGNDFGHRESRQGDVAEGKYYVLLPDGRLQTVEYTADSDGYHPKISYQQVGGGAGGYQNGGYPSGGSGAGGYQYRK